MLRAGWLFCGGYATAGRRRGSGCKTCGAWERSKGMDAVLPDVVFGSDRGSQASSRLLTQRSLGRRLQRPPARNSAITTSDSRSRRWAQSQPAPGQQRFPRGPGEDRLAGVQAVLVTSGDFYVRCLDRLEVATIGGWERKNARNT